MKILVFSDSHGTSEDMILTAEALQPDRIFHLGDLWRDGEELTYAFPDLPVSQVVGNCDWNCEGLPVHQQLEVEGVSMLLTHGHLYGIKRGYSSALSYASAQGARVLLCGHTHMPLCGEHQGILLVNPGSVRYTHTYAVLEIQNGTPLCAIRKIV